MKTDTPETDAAYKYWPSENAELVDAALARKLERERDEWARLCGQYKQERDEAWEDSAHWKVEYEIVEARLCGWKHPRDNGIIFEHEIIPKLTQERDKAREALDEETKFHHRTHRELVLTQCKLMDVTHNIIATLEQNRHLADGDDCTLFKLKSVVERLKLK